MIRAGAGLLAGLTFLAAGTAAAQSDDPRLAACYKTADNVAASDCIADLIQVEDDRLNEVYGLLMDSIATVPWTTNPAEALRQAERAWIRYRDDNCAWHGAMLDGGSGTGLAVQACLFEMTRLRADELQAWYEGRP